MNTLKAGAVLLSVWSGLNLLVGLAVTGAILLGKTAPIVALTLGSSDIPARDPRLLAIIDAQAALANPLIVALCGLVLVIVWTSLVRRARWSLWALVLSLVPLQTFGFVSDAFLGHANLLANVVSSAMLVTGLGLSAIGTRRG